MKFAIAAIAAAFGLLAVPSSQAQNATVFVEQGQLIRASQNVTALGADLMGDKVNLYTGALEFVQTDVSLPGNNALSVSIGRRYVAGIQRQNFYEGHFVDWDLEIPHLHGTYAGGNATLPGWVVWATPAGSNARLLRCSNFNPPPEATNVSHAIIEPDEFWGGHFLYVPGEGDVKLLKRDPANTSQPTDGYGYPIVTKSNWQFRCITGLASPLTVNGTQPAGEGFVAVSPAGTKYLFNWMVSRPYMGMSNSTGTVSRQEVWVMPTLVTDRFGNTVTYTYDTTDPWKLMSIVASDGRQITLTYGSGHRVASIYDGTRVWSYGYNNSVAGTTGSRLVSTTLPDASSWSFSLNEQTWAPSILPANRCQGGIWSDGTLTPNTLANTITHPSGAVGTFTLSFVMHGRSAMTGNSGNPCNGYFGEGPTPAYGIRSLVSKTIAGPGIAGMTWSYAWGPANGSWYCTGSCPTSKTLIVTDPRGYATRYTFGNKYAVTEGQLQSKDEGWDGSNALRNTVMTYRPAGAGPYPTMPGYSGSGSGDDVMQNSYLPLSQSTVTQQGVAFNWQGIAFDTTARVTSENQTNSLGYSRSASTGYSDNTTKWVLGQLASRTLAGVVTESTSYDAATAVPLSTYRFGKPKASYAFNADGTLYTWTDGAGHVTTFTNYKRGLAQNIAYADGSADSAVVNNLGLVTNLTNGAGTTTVYGYDAVGRLSQITPPGGDPVAYNPTTIAYQQVAADEYGLGVNHWRQTITTGSGVTINYFDAMLRKRVSTTADTSNPAATQRAQLFQYDADNRGIFTSYPARTVASITSTPPGIATLFDALGRPYQNSADSELGVLNTTTQYLSGFQRQDTNARGFITTTSYQTFAQPSESAPVLIAAPEGLSVTVSRDIFGKPLSITRSGTYGGATVSATRSYVYDGNQLLCKTVEPEVGATIQSLDGADNVAWRAAGLALTSTSSCDVASVPGASMVAYTYDGRNRVTGTGFGDGSPSIGRAYTGDGLPRTVVSNGSTWTYSYNNRRLLIQESLSYGSVYNIGWGYDANGNLSQLSYPDGSSVAYSPNALGEAGQVGAYANGINYQPNGAVAGYTLGNGIAHTQSQNIRGLPLQNRDAGVVQDQYTFDANANVTAISDQQEGVTSRTMGYDGLDRLTAANASGLWGSGSYSYDPLDNVRTSVVGSRSSTLSYDALNRLSNINTNGTYTGYAYDARGNVTGRGTQGFYFDQGNRMQLASGAASYAYDGLGRRTSINGTNGVYRVQVYSRSGQLLYGTWQQGMTIVNTRYVYVGGKQISETSSTTGTTYVHTDALGSPVARTDPSAGLLGRTRYEAYGSIAAGTVLSGIGFTGHVNDPDTGLVYMQQRYYDPIAGRFLSTDPVTTDANTGAKFDRYMYANNNPYRYTDPDGRESVGEFIDRSATESASAGNGAATYGWAFAGVAWKAFGSEGISQMADKGAGSSAADKVSAGFEAMAAVVPGGKLLGEAGAATAKLTIGTAIPAAERTAMSDIFKGTKALSEMSPAAREAAAKVFDQTASKEGQHELGKAFNEARATFMRGEGPNPGANAVEFGKRNSIPLPGKQPKTE